MSFSEEICIGISAPEVKLAAALFSNKKLSPEYADAPDADEMFLCDGLWAAEKLIERKIPVPMFFVCNEKLSEKELALAEKMKKYAKKTYVISEKTCAKISDRDGAEGAFIVALMPKLTLDDIKLKDNMTAIILDGQEQPGNIGAIIRSLDAAGGDFAIYTNRRVKMTHPRLIRSSLGAAFMMPFICVEFDELLEWLSKNNFRAIVTDLTATKSFYDVDFSGRVAIVCGNEYLGISPEWRKQKFAESVIIPMLGSVESLNVGFASTLVAYECSLRQKGMIERSEAKNLRS